LRGINVEYLRIKKDMSMEEIDRFTEQCIKAMTLKEKVYCMTGRRSMLAMLMDIIVFRHYNRVPYCTTPVKRLGIPAVKFSDGPKGVVMGKSTCFPVTMARGASFDKKLEERIGEAVAREIRAQGGNFFGGVCINLLRHPAWGRAQETYGEDTYHLGEMGAALVRGVQKHNVMACIKYYAANSMENSRFKVNVRLSQRTLREVYLPHFKRCIDEGAASVMGAYNRLLNEQCCESKLLLQHILRDEWKFDGFTISDFVYGIKDAAKAVQSGLDIEMPSPLKYGKKLMKLLETGDIKESYIDRSAACIIRTIVKFASRKEHEKYTKGMIVSPEHRKLALEAAEKSMVLIKNDSVLPFNKRSIKKLALIGKLATVENTGDHGSSRVHPPYVITPMKGLSDYLQGVQLLYFDGQDLEAAKRGAEEADAVIIVAGCEHNDEGEYLSERMQVGGDRKYLTLKPNESALINSIAPLNKNTAVALIGGSAIVMEDWQHSAPAILMAFYSGMEGGRALAKILFGEANPSGKLPFTIARKESDYPFFDSTLEEIEYGYYHGYTLFDKEDVEPAFHFGHGLSYTQFRYKNAEIQVNGDEVKVSLIMKNVGKMPGEEVVQLYVGFENSSVDRPKKVLKGFKKIYLNPGVEKKVTLTVKKKDLAYYDEVKKCWVDEDIDYSAYIGISSNEKDLSKLAFRFS
jgi:beta-glucosidase